MKPMTREQEIIKLAKFVATRTGKTDFESKSICVEYIRAIWFWPDTSVVDDALDSIRENRKFIEAEFNRRIHK
jgi:hypothetical protein